MKTVLRCLTVGLLADLGLERNLFIKNMRCCRRGWRCRG